MTIGANSCTLLHIIFEKHNFTNNDQKKMSKEVVTRIYSLLLKQVTPIFPGKIDWPNNSCFYAQVYIKCISKYAMYPLKFICIKSHLWTLPFHGEFSIFPRLTKNTSALNWWRRYYDAVVKTERPIYTLSPLATSWRRWRGAERAQWCSITLCRDKK